MSETTDNVINRKLANPEFFDKVWYKSARLVLNLIIHVLLFFTVVICLWFSCRSGNVSKFDWHIILCVLGYQFFMVHGILAMSPLNSWSMFLSRRYRKHTHWVMQVLAAALVTAGTVIIYRMRRNHFVTVHGKLGSKTVKFILWVVVELTCLRAFLVSPLLILVINSCSGLVALVFCLASLLNGVLAMYPTKLSSCIPVFLIRFFHYVTGLLSLFTATGSLCAGFEYGSFRGWADSYVFVNTLIGLTWVFTILVSIDFCITTVNKIRSII